VLLLFATTVGLGLAKTPTFACRGGATAFGGAAGTIGIGCGTFAMTGFGGSTSTGGLIFGGSSFAICFCGGATTFTGGIFGGGGGFSGAVWKVSAIAST
jgi:hypothetical protein